MSETSEKNLNKLKKVSSGDVLNENIITSSDDVNDSDKKNSSESGYRMRPELSEKFKPQVVKELIHNVLYDQLSTKKYNVEEARTWSKIIADTIRNKVKELKFKQYKFVVNVVIGEQKGAGVKLGNRCLWDAEADSYAHENFSNDSLFCIACVYAVFFY